MPRDLVDEQTSPPSDEQEMKDDTLGGFASEEPSAHVPRDGGDDADATTAGGPDPESPSRTGSRVGARAWQGGRRRRVLGRS